MKALALLLSTSLAALVGCGPTAQTEEIPGPGAEDDPAPIPPPPPGEEPVCGEQQEEIELIDEGAPPDMLIVLDRSGSMTSQVPSNGSFPVSGDPTRWQVMEDALTTLTNSQQGNINFGLTVFPTDESCGVAAGALVEPAPNTANDIQTDLAAWAPVNGLTPGAASLVEAKAIYDSLPVNPDGRFVLFATDGVPNCAGDPDDETITAIEDLHADGIDTFVLGFGDGVDPGILDDAAVAGGQAKQAGPPYYYQAGNSAELAMVLDQIAGGVIVPSCEYELAEPPPDPDNVTVLADGNPVPRDESGTDGWHYAPDDSHITFTGSYCDQIESGSISSVEFVFGCSGPIIE